MQNLTMTAIRNSSFRNAVRREYERARRSGITVTEGELLKRVVNSPVKDGYFVGVAHAVKMVRMALRDSLPDWMSENRRAMWAEIASKVAERQKLRREQIVDSVARVLDSATASRYFISDSSARRIVSVAMRRRQQQGKEDAL